MRVLILACVAAVLSCSVLRVATADFGDELLRITDPEAFLRFGSSVDISGSTLVVGSGMWESSEEQRLCPRVDPEPVNPDEVFNHEAVFVYDYLTGDQPLHTLRRDTPTEGDWFGASVAVDGNLAIVGAPFEDATGLDTGAAYLFDVTTGQQLFKLVPDDARPFQRLGGAVAIDGDRAVVGSSCMGAAYVYDTATGSLLHTLSSDYQGFGYSLAIEGETVIVGSNVSPAEIGSTVVAFNTATGNQLWEYTSQDGGDSFGFAVDISGNRVIVGAPLADSDGFWMAGAAHVLNASTGEYLFELEPRSRKSLQTFGYAVAIDGGRALVGSLNEFRGAQNVGAVQVYDVATGERLQSIWADRVGQAPVLGHANFGFDLAMAGLTAVVGTPGADVVHVLDLSGVPPPEEELPPPPPPITFAPGTLQPGDAERDLDFDRFDIVRVLAANKYQTGEPATWGEGDWDEGVGTPDEPAEGDGQFNGSDLVKALIAGFYQTGPYDEGGSGGISSLPIQCCGVQADDRTSLVYDPETGELAVDAPAGRELTSINIDSATGIFTGDAIPSDRNLDVDTDHTLFKAIFEDSFGSFSFGNVAQTELSSDFLLRDLSATGSLAGGGMLGIFDLVYLSEAGPTLMPGDADQDLKFDQLDVLRVLIAGKYRTGETATWGEGDWDGAPGGAPGSPPEGNGVFDQLDIVVALAGNTYLTGAYAGIVPGGASADEQTSLVYDANTGELALDAPESHQLTSINITSASGLFVGQPAENLGGDFDNDTDDNIFKATFGSSFGSLSFGDVAQPRLSEEFVLNDLAVVGSLAGGGGLGPVDLIFVAVPEPSSILLLSAGLVIITLLCRRRVQGAT